MSARNPLNIGDRFGRLCVVKDEGKERVTATCDCGATWRGKRSALRLGRTVSCGCYWRETFPGSQETHGGHGTPEYKSWCSMKARCTNPKREDFARYGGRGITVCDRWRDSFEAFLADVGQRPTPQHSIDRIDSAGNYEPDNVKWSTRNEQARNTRHSVSLTLHGETRCLAEWSEHIGIGYSTLWSRIRRGWPVEKVLANSRLGFPAETAEPEP